MRLGILTGEPGWHAGDLERAGRDAGCEVVAFDYRSLTAELACGAERFALGGRTLDDLDGLLVRAMPHGTLEQVVFRMDLLGRLEACGVRVVNPPRAIECAVDKYLTLARLAAAGLPVPRTRVCEQAGQALEDFAALGGDVVAKPLFGSLGRGMLRLSDPDLAERAYGALERLGCVIYQQEFVAHPGWDYRLFVLDGELIAAMRRRASAALRAGGEPEWRTNVARGALPESAAPPAEVVALALRAAEVVGTTVAGIDILPGLDGGFRVLELNAAPGWKALAGVTGVDVARRIIDSLLRGPA